MALDLKTRKKHYKKKILDLKYKKQNELNIK